MSTIAVLIPDESYKKQLIGRDALTFRAFREITGVELVIDDDPTQVFLKSEDEGKLQTARRVLQSMIRVRKFAKEDIRFFAKSS